MQRHLTTRRKVVLGTGALAIGGVSVFSTEDVSAVELDFGQFKVEDTTAHGDVESVDVSVSVNGKWESDVVPDAIELELSAGADGLDLTELDSKTIAPDMDQSGAIEQTLQANVLESSSLSQSDFELLLGQSERHVDVGFELIGSVLKDGTVLAESKIQETATVIVQDAHASIELKATGTMET